MPSHALNRGNARNKISFTDGDDEALNVSSSKGLVPYPVDLIASR